MRLGGTCPSDKNPRVAHGVFQMVFPNQQSEIRCFYKARLNKTIYLVTFWRGVLVFWVRVLLGNPVGGPFKVSKLQLFTNSLCNSIFFLRCP